MEREAEFRHEYYRGEILMMAGASLTHNRISENLSIGIGSFLKSKRKDCQSFSRDLRVFVPSEEFYTYPDLVAVCGKLEVLDAEKTLY